MSSSGKKTNEILIVNGTLLHPLPFKERPIGADDPVSERIKICVYSPEATSFYSGKACSFFAFIRSISNRTLIQES